MTGWQIASTSPNENPGPSNTWTTRGNGEPAGGAAAVSAGHYPLPKMYSRSARCMLLTATSCFGVVRLPGKP
jgi:hypothetical protein